MQALRLLYTGLILLTYVGCGVNGASNQMDHLPYFDLSGYITEAIKDSLLVSVEKSISTDNQTEAKRIPEYALWKDIESFSSYDINRSALFDKYSVDTTIIGTRKEIISIANDKTLQVQSQKVVYENDQITDIEIKTASNSFLGNIELEILWEPGKGYILRRNSDRIFGEKTSQTIVVEKK